MDEFIAVIGDMVVGTVTARPVLVMEIPTRENISLINAMDVVYTNGRMVESLMGSFKRTSDMEKVSRNETDKVVLMECTLLFVCKLCPSAQSCRLLLSPPTTRYLYMARWRHLQG
jgi:hypothetical protein